jgi:aspartate racemase
VVLFISGNKIGVLGGIGPESSAYFYSELIRKLQLTGITDNIEYPQIIINSINAPFLIGDIDNKIKYYVQGIKLLDDVEPQFIVMVCNTVHAYYDVLQSSIDTPILSLISVVKEYLQQKGMRKIMVLGTSTTVKAKIYEFDNIKTIYPIEDEQSTIDLSIEEYNINKSSAEKILKIAEKYVGDVDCFILGCTEVALMLKDTRLNGINTMDLLVDATIEKMKYDTKK